MLAYTHTQSLISVYTHTQHPSLSTPTLNPKYLSTTTLQPQLTTYTHLYPQCMYTPTLNDQCLSILTLNPQVLSTSILKAKCLHKTQPQVTVYLIIQLQESVHTQTQNPSVYLQPQFKPKCLSTPLFYPQVFVYAHTPHTNAYVQ